MFIYPMWDNESQRIGKQRCTPLGYALHATAEWLGFISFFLLLGVCIFLGYKVVFKTFRASLLWLVAVPFGLGFMGEVMYRLSWWMARRKGFEYDWDAREASWYQDGKRVTYKCKEWEAG